MSHNVVCSESEDEVEAGPPPPRSQKRKKNTHCDGINGKSLEYSSVLLSHPLNYLPEGNVQHNKRQRIASRKQNMLGKGSLSCSAFSSQRFFSDRQGEPRQPDQETEEEA